MASSDTRPSTEPLAISAHPKSTPPTEYDSIEVLRPGQKSNDVASPRHTLSASKARLDTPQSIEHPTTITGSAANPIDLETLRSPPAKILRPPVHQFASRRFPVKRAIYGPSTHQLPPLPPAYKPSRPQRVVRPPDGNTSVFTGHHSHDLYKMLAAKLAAKNALPWGPTSYLDKTHSTYPSPGSQKNLAVPSDPHPKRDSTQYVPIALKPQPQPQPLLGAYGQPVAPAPVPAMKHGPAPYQYRSMPSGYMPPGHMSAGPIPPQPYYLNTVPPTYYPNETALRNKALQYVREATRPRPRKRAIFEDPDATSGSEDEGDDAALLSRSHISSDPATITSTKRAHNDEDRRLALTELISHTSLLTSLLSLYPHSASQPDLREDIAMLQPVINQRVQNWLTAENVTPTTTTTTKAPTTPLPRTAKRPRLITHPYPSPAPLKPKPPPAIVVLTPEEVARQKLDDDMRKYISSENEIWKGAEGPRLVDLYRAGAGAEGDKDDEDDQEVEDEYQDADEVHTVSSRASERTVSAAASPIWRSASVKAPGATKYSPVLVEGATPTSTLAPAPATPKDVDMLSAEAPHDAEQPMQG
ncbi:hypothetical protein BDV95DRAFT_319599 [Massariosphaeria phaeospora]|uniref:Uncharacterized protein n=1 Tax=Massariosphaeria phaeospora TaxID=100035 RepID=A0A7C8ID18_9PLEO|nr:hypothetical protein BDV95DRAFT_319599 [Massariosphaeria phaeospora]